MEKYSETELMLTPDGRIYHLHLYPEQLCDTVLLVGDPGRIPAIAAHLESPRELAYNREFRSVSGKYHGQPILALSHGIGAGCIDIVVNELDALANIDFSTRDNTPEHRQLRLVRLGTSGALKSDIPFGTLLITAAAIGLDSVPFFYHWPDGLPGAALAYEFENYMHWPHTLPKPYSIGASEKLLNMFSNIGMPAITLCCPGFYAPQGRTLRFTLYNEEWMERLAGFSSNGLMLGNMEMESAPLMMLATLLGHQSITISVPVDNRASDELPQDVDKTMDETIEKVLAQLTEEAELPSLKVE